MLIKADTCDTLVLPGGRKLRYATYGAPLQGGYKQAVIYLHGWPTCHLEALWLDSEARKQQLAIVAVDRPGFGGSTFNPSGTFETFAEDMVYLLNHLRLRKVVIVGTSGGAGFATACAALLPAGRVQHLLLLSPLAPVKGKEKQLLRDTSPMQHRFFHAVKTKPWAARLQLLVGRKLIRLPYGSKLIQLMFSKIDRQALKKHTDQAAKLKTAEREGLRQGVAGPLRDMQLYCSKDWSTPVENIRCSTTIWHGDMDRTTPTSMAQLYSTRIPHSKLRMIPNEGHISMIFKNASDIVKSITQELSKMQ